MYNIVLIGAGQIGSRHLQGLSLLDEKLHSLFVVDPNTDSLQTAKHRFEEVNTKDFKISYLQNLNSLPEHIDFCIIATSSTIRRKIIEDLVLKCNIKYLILEKFLFPNINDYTEVDTLLKTHKIKTFVNCARRMYDGYHFLKERIGDEKLNFEAIGNNWGLGSNGIHILDIFSFLTLDKPIVIVGNELDTAILNSKRESYIEFTGKISAKNKLGSSFSATSYSNDASPVIIYITTPTKRIIVKEIGAQHLISISDKSNNWVWEDRIFSLKFQSRLSHLFIESLQKTKTCSLTGFKHSSKLHLSLLKHFVKHQNKTLNSKSIQCPIT